MRQGLDLDLQDPEWLTLLKIEQEKGKSISQIAREIDMKRPSVSMLLNGKYPAESLDLVSRKHGAKIVKIYRNRVLCPHLRDSIGVAQCEAYAKAPMSTSNPEKMKQWAACRNCPQNPTKGENDG
ncbi:MAG: helix-turn-helix domain-containing protein [Pseudoruegeria sp.]